VACNPRLNEMSDKRRDALLPTAGVLRRAIEVYLAEAYEGRIPPAAARVLPGPDFDVAEYLMGNTVERTPAPAEFQDVRSFALRLGNALYPNMKLKLSRPNPRSAYVFSVDLHDAFLQAPGDSPDQAALEDLKRHNSSIALAVRAAWEAAGLPTEKSFLRQQIEQARRKKEHRTADDAG